MCQIFCETYFSSNDEVDNIDKVIIEPILWPLQYLIKPPFILIRKDGRYLKIRRGRLQNEGAEGPDVPIAAHFAFKFWNNSNLKYLIFRIIQIEIVVPFMLMLHSNYKINKKSTFYPSVQ